MRAHLRESLPAAAARDVRGRGLMLGIDLSIPATQVVEAGWAHGLLMVNAGPDTLRFVPPLIIEPAHVDALIDKLGAILDDLAGQ